MNRQTIAKAAAAPAAAITAACDGRERTLIPRRSAMSLRRPSHSFRRNLVGSDDYEAFEFDDGRGATD
jgi:hypothetical protein